MKEREDAENFIIVAPCFNEEAVITRFLDELEEVLAPTGRHFDVIVVDDGSTDRTPEILKQYSFHSPRMELHPIRLKYNMGHQGAIRQGLLHVKKLNKPFKGIIVMDSDGEDDPHAIKKILDKPSFDIIFFERGKRRESLAFRTGYFIYKMIFKLITGKTLNFGNFSAISRRVWEPVHYQKFFHYAGFLSKSKWNKEKIKTDRRARFDGKSKMSYHGLVMHGLKSFVEYSEELLFFFIKALILIIFLSLIFTGVVLYKKFISKAAILGWASTIGTNLIIILLIIISFIVMSVTLLSVKNLLTQPDDALYDEIK